MLPLLDSGLPCADLLAANAMGQWGTYGPALLPAWLARMQVQVDFSLTSFSLFRKINIVLFGAPNIAHNITISLVSTSSSQWSVLNLYLGLFCCVRKIQNFFLSDFRQALCVLFNILLTCILNISCKTTSSTKTSGIGQK